MNASKTFFLAAQFFVAACAGAQVATLDCGTDHDAMVVRYLVNGRMKTHSTQSVVFWDLVRPKRCPADGPCNVTATLTREFTCRKPLGQFKFRFRAVPFNANLQGQCGGRVTGELVLSLNGKVVLPATVFEDASACFGNADEPPEIRSISIDPKSGKSTMELAKSP